MLSCNAIFLPEFLFSIAVISFVFFTQSQCNLGNQIISVERVSQYMDIPSEAAEVIEDNRPLPDWPQNGNVEIRHLKVINVNMYT